MQIVITRFMVQRLKNILYIKISLHKGAMDLFFTIASYISDPLCGDCGSPPVRLPLCLLLDVSGERPTIHDSPKPAGHELHDISAATFPIRLYSWIWNSCHHHYYLCSNATRFIWNRKLVSCVSLVRFLITFQFILPE